jgi:hypothetical protein
MQLLSVNLIAGFMIGMQYEDLTDDGDYEYLIINLGLVEIIYYW